MRGAIPRRANPVGARERRKVEDVKCKGDGRDGGGSASSVGGGKKGRRKKGIE